LCYFQDWSSIPDGRPDKRAAMNTKVCTNPHCSAYAHFVYTVAMRCVLCRCDLTAAQRNPRLTGLPRSKPYRQVAGLISNSARTGAR
jgi:hypothetical protein